MVETLQDMSLQAETEELIEEPSLAEAAVSAAASAEDAEAQVEPSEPSAEELEIARDLVRSARARGVAMTGPEGMLKALTKTVIETALDEEMTEHLGYGKHEVRGRGSGNSRNGTRTKTVLTETVGDVEVEVPRDQPVGVSSHLHRSSDSPRPAGTMCRRPPREHHEQHRNVWVRRPPNEGRSGERPVPRVTCTGLGRSSLTTRWSPDSPGRLTPPLGNDVGSALSGHLLELCPA